MRKGFTLIELLSVIVILAVLAVIAYPIMTDIVSDTKLNAYDVAKKNIIKASKLKYLADANGIGTVEYTVDELIDENYLDDNAKNPITNEKYENTKVMITNEEGVVTYNYIEGSTLYDIVSSLEEDGLYKERNMYIYRGENVKNYVSFFGQIYRILKIDSYGNVYILGSSTNENITKNNIYDYKTSYYNDNYTEKVKRNIKSFELLNYEDYANSFSNNNTYIINNNNLWVKSSLDYKILSYTSNTFVDENSGYIRFVLKLKNNISVKEGNGSQLKPYVLE